MPNSPSAYARTKAAGEKAVLASIPDAVILRPSIVFGPEDDFFNRFAALARISPVLPLIGGGKTKFQPVYVGDVAEAIAEGRRRQAAAAHDLRTRRAGSDDLPPADGAHAARDRAASACSCRCRSGSRSCRRISCNLLPTPLLTPDQVELLQADNIVSQAAEREGRTLQGARHQADGDGSDLPGYLWRFRKAGQFTRIARLSITRASRTSAAMHQARRRRRRGSTRRAEAVEVFARSRSRRPRRSQAKAESDATKPDKHDRPAMRAELQLLCSSCRAPSEGAGHRRHREKERKFAPPRPVRRRAAAPPTMVEPERETPGTSARHWQTPMHEIRHSAGHPIVRVVLSASSRLEQVDHRAAPTASRRSACSRSEALNRTPLKKPCGNRADQRGRKESKQNSESRNAAHAE